MQLSKIKLGWPATVEQLQTEDLLVDRLKDFGFVPGTKVRGRYRSPGGQMMAVECRGTVIALRTKDLEKIQVRCI